MVPASVSKPGQIPILDNGSNLNIGLPMISFSGSGPQTLESELAALLSRATQVLQDKDRDLDALQDLVAQIDRAITAGVDESELQDLSDKLLDTLYDLDEG